MSLMEQLTNAVVGQIAGQAAQKTGLSDDMAAKLMPMAMSVLMGGLKKNAASPEGAQALSNALDRHDGGMLDNLSALTNDDTMADGQKILGHILGGRQNGAQEMMAQATGANASQINNLLAMAAPAVLASLGKAKREQGLGVSDLANLVNAEGAAAQKAAPSELGGLMSMLDADGDGDVKEEVMSLGAKLLGGLFKKR